MAISLGRTLYNLGRGRGALPEPQRTARPLGEVVWFHAPTAASVTGLEALALRTIEELGAATVLTCPEPDLVGHGVIGQAPPPDRPDEARRFLDHWRPRLVVFAEGELRPALIAEIEARGILMFMVNAREPYLLKERDGWYPGLIRTCLAAQKRVFAIDDTAARAFRKAGSAEIAIIGRLEEPSAALPHHEPERAALAALVATRPVWVAVGVPASEEALVIAAHRSALRLAHRLLLIFVPQNFDRAQILADTMEQQEGWAVAQRRLDEEPDPETTVYIPDSDSEYGLWYRLAPVCFMGGSLAGEGCSRNPMEAAAMGSAIIYGLRAGRYGSAFGRLGAAQAARAVGAADELAEALGDLLAPDRTAKLAQAAWVLSSDGVEATATVFEHIRHVIEEAV